MYPENVQKWLNFHLEDALRTCAAATSTNDILSEIVERMKDGGIRKGRGSVELEGQKLFESAQKTYRTRVAEMQAKGEKLPIEAEMYERWLEECVYALDATEVCHPRYQCKSFFSFSYFPTQALLEVKVPGTKRRVTGLGRILFPLLYTILDELITSVNATYEGFFPTYRCREPFQYDDDDDAEDWGARDATATKKANAILERYDAVMLKALERYKKESNKKQMAGSIRAKEDDLARGLWLVAEQARWGPGGAQEMGFGLMEKTRDAMQDWANEVRTNSAHRSLSWYTDEMPFCGSMKRLETKEAVLISTSEPCFRFILAMYFYFRIRCA